MCMTGSMEKKNDEDDLLELADIYSVLKSDAKTIVADLQGGVTMWREAAAGAIASAGFVILIHFSICNSTRSRLLN